MAPALSTIRQRPNDRQAIWLHLAAGMAQRSWLRRALSRPLLYVLRAGTTGIDAYFLFWLGLCLIGGPLAVGLGYGKAGAIVLNGLGLLLIVAMYFLFGWVDRKVREAVGAARRRRKV